MHALFHVDRLGDRDHRALGGVVRRAREGARIAPRPRGNVDDETVAALAHARDHRVAAVEQAVEVDAHDLVPALLRHVLEIARVARDVGAGAGDEDVDAPVALLDIGGDRVYRLLALRYHPDNAETGDGEYFRKLTYAYTVLSDSAKRAAHDVRRESVSGTRLRLFTRSTGASGAAAERRKRQGALAALYQKRLQDPHAPTLSIFDLEELLGVPREHLEFTLWYLKERGCLVRTDNNRFQITVVGVDEAERLEAESMPQDRLLPAAT